MEFDIGIYRHDRRAGPEPPPESHLFFDGLIRASGYFQSVRSRPTAATQVMDPDTGEGTTSLSMLPDGQYISVHFHFDVPSAGASPIDLGSAVKLFRVGTFVQSLKKEQRVVMFLMLRRADYQLPQFADIPLYRREGLAWTKHDIQLDLEAASLSREQIRLM
ncbi:MAG: hypothetical protein Q9227_005896 [Pyrenula ochraceoflavens]